MHSYNVKSYSLHMKLKLLFLNMNLLSCSQCICIVSEKAIRVIAFVIWNPAILTVHEIHLNEPELQASSFAQKLSNRIIFGIMFVIKIGLSSCVKFKLSSFIAHNQRNTWKALKIYWKFFHIPNISLKNHQKLNYIQFFFLRLKTIWISSA